LHSSSTRRGVELVKIGQKLTQDTSTITNKGGNSFIADEEKQAALTLNT
jgi:hypothetical protein